MIRAVAPRDPQSLLIAISSEHLALALAPAGELPQSLSRSPRRSLREDYDLSAGLV
jgi:hypothetical protein